MLQTGLIVFLQEKAEWMQQNQKVQSQLQATNVREIAALRSIDQIKRELKVPYRCMCCSPVCLLPTTDICTIPDFTRLMTRKFLPFSNKFGIQRPVHGQVTISCWQSNLFSFTLLTRVWSACRIFRVDSKSELKILMCLSRRATPGRLS